MLQYLTLIDWFVLAFCFGLFNVAIFTCYMDEKLQKRLMTLFTGWTIITYKRAASVPWLSSWFAKSDLYIMVEIPIPNALIVASYLFCCVMSIILLP